MTKAKGGFKIRKDGKKDTGRPTKLTPETIEVLERCFLAGLSDVQACFKANIGKTALYEYQKRNPAFAERKEALKENTEINARMNISASIASGDKELSKWYLERKCKNEFSTRQEQQIEAKGINIVVASDEAKKLIEEV